MYEQYIIKKRIKSKLLNIYIIYKFISFGSNQFKTITIGIKNLINY